MHGAGTWKRVANGTRKDPRTSAIRHGLYAKHAPPDMKALIEAAGADPEPARLEGEIALLRAHAVRVGERAVEDDYTNAMKVQDLVRLATAIGDLASKHAKIADSVRLNVTASSVDQYLEKVLFAVEAVCGKAKARRIVEVLQRLVRAGDGAVDVTPPAADDEPDAPDQDATHALPDGDTNADDWDVPDGDDALDDGGDGAPLALPEVAAASDGDAAADAPPPVGEVPAAAPEVTP